MQHRVSFSRPGLNQLLGLALLALTTPMLAMAQPAGTNSQVELLDRIVAVVNDQAITQRQLEARISQIGGDTQDQRDLAERVLDRMITEQVQANRAQNIGIEIDDTRLNEALQGIAQQNNLTLPQLREAIAQQGQDWSDFRQEIRNQMLNEQLIQREVFSQIDISDEDIDEFIRQQTGGAEQTEYQLAQILIAVPDNATPDDIAQAQQRADSVMEQLEGGADFAQVSIERSDAPNATEGGDLGWRDPARIPSLFLDPVTALQPGEVTQPIRSPNGFHIVKLSDTRTTSSSITLRQYQTAHVLIRPEDAQSPQQAREQAESLREQIISGERTFEQVARDFSADQGSATRGGQLGWVNPSDMVDPFAQAMQQTPVGEISPVFETQFGFHFLRVNNQREQEIPPEQLRDQARQAIGERRADEEIVRYIRRLRAEAYIENRLSAN